MTPILLAEKAELPIPTAINALISQENIQVKVLATPSKWFGVTFQADKAEVKAKIALAAKGINFETASDVIKAESFDDLGNLINLLNEFPEAKVEIQGHTDNTGVKDDVKRAANNKDLSQRRANSVMAYLTSNGISSERLTAVGYGEEKPIADNKSAAGKAKNRRVDFILAY